MHMRVDSRQVPSVDALNQLLLRLYRYLFHLNQFLQRVHVEHHTLYQGCL